jgi:hypothetical protein
MFCLVFNAGFLLHFSKQAAKLVAFQIAGIGMCDMEPYRYAGFARVIDNRRLEIDAGDIGIPRLQPFDSFSSSS